MANLRDSQDVSLSITQPSGTAERLSQDVTLVIAKLLPYNPAIEPHDDEGQRGREYFFRGIEQGADESVIQVAKKVYIVTFVST